MVNDKAYHAIVDKVVNEGEHGPYAVARCEELGVVTFSLDSKVWQEEEHPESGTCVVLSRVFKKRAGWRARTGRLFQPSDQQPETRREQRA